MTRAQRLSFLTIILAAAICLAAPRRPRGVTGATPEEHFTYCDADGFNFFNGFNQPENSSLTYVLWDYDGSGFNDGSNDAFDTFLSVAAFANREPTPTNNLPTRQQLDFSCGADNTTAKYQFTFPTEHLHLNRRFWVPRDPNVNWARVVDTFTNQANESVSVNVLYFNNLGSDGSTIFEYQTTYSFVSHDTGGGDPVVGCNFGNQDGDISAHNISMVKSSDTPTWTFTFELAAGASASIMTVVSQSAFTNDALETTRYLETTPAIITQDLEDFTNILNWDLCSATFASSQSDICSTPATIQVEGIHGFEVAIEGTDIDFTPNTSPFNVALPRGTYKLTFQRHASCTKRTQQLAVVEAPESNLSVEVSTVDSWPVGKASGGYGTYTYKWTTEVQSLKDSFGKNNVLTVTDAKGCSISKQVAVPALPVTDPEAGISGANLLSALSATTIVIALTFL